MSPTQPMSYVIGKLMLLDLRERMRRKLGSGFDLKQFHDELISYGTIPPALISEQMLSQPSTKKETRQLRKSA